MFRPPPRSTLFPYPTVFRSTPFPESETVVGDDGAVLVTFREPACEPTVAGLKLTLTRAVCPGVRTAGSVVADARRNAGELGGIALMVRFAVPGVFRTEEFPAGLHSPL